MTMLRPTLVPGLPRVWRGPHTLQLGLDPARAVLLDLPDPRAAALLDLLDGTRPERAALSRMARAGVGHDDCRALLDTLYAAGYVRSATALLPAALPDPVRRRLAGEAAALALAEAGDRRPAGPAPAAAAHRGPSPAAILRRRQAARVVVSGWGRLGLPIAVALAEAGVGHLWPEIPDPGPGRRTGLANRHRPGPSGVPQAVTPVAGRWHVGRPSDPVPLRQVGADTERAGHARAAVKATGTSAGCERAAGEATAVPPGCGRAAAEVVEAIRRAAPGTVTRPVRRGTATLVIQLGHDQPVALLAAGHAARRQAHLAVAVREGTAVIGPLVPSRGGPCLLCIDLHRRDRDPAWAELSAQLGSPGPEPCRVTTVLAAAALAAAEALAYLDGAAPETLGAAVEVTGPGRMRRRTWPPHPRCGCTHRR